MARTHVIAGLKFSTRAANHIVVYLQGDREDLIRFEDFVPTITLEQIRSIDLAKLLKMRNIGRKTIAEIRRVTAPRTCVCPACGAGHRRKAIT